MALQVNFTYNGVEIKDAYIKVSSFDGNKTNLNYKYSVFNTIEASEEFPEHKSFIAELAAVTSLDLDGPNPVKQAYQHLKTLPSFEGAEDV